MQTYEEGVGCGVWILGKWMEPERIQALELEDPFQGPSTWGHPPSPVQALIRPDSLIIDFAVPHVSEDRLKVDSPLDVLLSIYLPSITCGSLGMQEVAKNFRYVNGAALSYSLHLVNDGCEQG